jgi:surface antigen
MTAHSGRITPLRAGSLPSRIAFVQPATTGDPSQGQAADAFDTMGILQCVPYARFLSGIGIHGDAWTWWDQAAGTYARGNHPEPGAVLSFPGIERMPLGHVAVVIQVLGARKILIDHANWPNAVVEHGAISRDIEVEDVSPANDWTEVRVQFGEGGPMGSVYPANGFIYGWNETGVRMAQSRFPPGEALWSPDSPGWRLLNATTYFWALPPARRKQAYAAAGVAPRDASPTHGRPLLLLGLPAGSLLNAGALVHPLGVNRLDAGFGGRSGFAARRYAVQWATVTR